jgi:hypothetical protein
MAPEPAPDPEIGTEMPDGKVPPSGGGQTMPQPPQASPAPGEKDAAKDEEDLKALRAALNDALKRDDRPAIDKAARKILDVAPKTEKVPRSIAHTALGRNELLAGHPRSAETEFAESLALVPDSSWTIFESLCAALVADDSSLIDTRRKALKEHVADGPQYFATARLLLNIREKGEHLKRAIAQVEAGKTSDPPVAKAVVAALRRRNK